MEEDFSNDILVKKKSKVKKPSLYKVILHNDDYTTMDFVVAVLVQIFQKNKAEAIQIMYDVHKSGKGLAGVYTKEIAETKVEMVHRSAKESGFPLLCTLEKE